MRDHRIDIAAADKKAQLRGAEAPHILRRLRLRKDADPEALGLQHAGDDRCTEAGVVDIGIAGNHHNIRLAPAALFHFLPGNR